MESKLMIVMHSLFNLDGDRTREEFKDAIKMFSEHLIEKGLLVSSRFMQHQSHDGYNADAPEGDFYLSMEFIDMTQAQACWDYVEADTEPVKSIHEKIKTSIRDSSFFLYADV